MDCFTRHFSSLILFLLLAPWCDAGFLQHIVHVQITNDIGNGSSLTVHCKSKNDDLGEHVLAPQGTWEFRFRPNVWGTTQYYCSMAWGGQVKWFDIFVANRDYPNCRVCKWSVKPKGPCRFNYATSKFDTCFEWNPHY